METRGPAMTDVVALRGRGAFFSALKIRQSLAANHALNA
jgi:hypothetical protein